MVITGSIIMYGVMKFLYHRQNVSQSPNWRSSLEGQPHCPELFALMPKPALPGPKRWTLCWRFLAIVFTLEARKLEHGPPPTPKSRKEGKLA